MQDATAALAAAGYRASRDQHHYRIIQSLREAIGAEPSLLTTFDAFRKKRNISGYARAGTVSDAEIKAMRQMARQPRDDVVGWLRRMRPKLLGGH